VAMPDRRKLAAPVLAQAASFVVVLVIGGFTGHSPARGSAGPGPSPHASASSPAATREQQQSGLTVHVPVIGGTAGITPDIAVRVLPSGSFSPAASGTLAQNAQGTELTWTRSLAAGTYQVCAKPPQGLRFTERDTGVQPGWTCVLSNVAPGSQAQVTFHLTQGVT
jgi:hypothetical protein